MRVIIKKGWFQPFLPRYQLFFANDSLSIQKLTNRLTTLAIIDQQVIAVNRPTIYDANQNTPMEILMMGIFTSSPRWPRVKDDRTDNKKAIKLNYSKRQIRADDHVSTIQCGIINNNLITSIIGGNCSELGIAKSVSQSVDCSQHCSQCCGVATKNQKANRVLRSSRSDVRRVAAIQHNRRTLIAYYFKILSAASQLIFKMKTA